MEIRELKKNELDFAVLPCVDPGFRRTLKEGTSLRKEFLRKMMRKGLSVLVALEEPGRKERIDYPGVGKVKTKDLSVNGQIIAGLIEYLPIEEATIPVKGKNLAFIDCIWVITPFWRRGVAKALMEKFFEKTHSDFYGSAVIAYEGEFWWGFFDYMPKWFFQKFGFRKVERDGNSILMFKNYKDVQPPKFILPKSKSILNSGRIKVELFWSNQCPYSWWVKKLAEKEFSKTSGIELNFVNTDNRKTVEKSGIIFGLTIDRKIIYNRTPSWDEVKKVLKSVKSVSSVDS
jgi:GNAT superfamily N-acetyltransferase